MLSCHYTKDLLNLQDVIVTKIQHFESHILIYTQLAVKPHLCPCCKHETSYIHDYRKRKIKDISAFGKHVTLIHNHRRYVCKHCGKRFAEDNSFAPKYYRVTLRLINEIFRKTESEISFTSIAKDVNLSVSTVIRFFDMLAYDTPKELPQVLSKWILIAQNSRLKDYQDCAATLQNWAKSIFNTFDYPYTNGFTEGCNNKIKVLKRNAYGYRNFNRFRKRILHMFNYKKSNIGKAAA